MICDFCFCVIPDDLDDVPAPMQLEEDTERMCTKCAQFYIDNLYLLSADCNHVNRAIGANKLTKEDIDVLDKNAVGEVPQSSGGTPQTTISEV